MSLNDPGSGEALDLRRAARVAWRHKVILGVAVLLGLFAGAAVGVLNPPMLTSKTLVLLPPTVKSLTGGPTHNITTQLAIAGSNPVMAGAAGRVQPPVPLPALRSRVQVTSPSPQIISISGSGTTAAQAQSVANAVARSYIAYLTSPGSPHPLIAEPATPGAGTPAVVRLVVAGVLGALAGLLAGVVVALAVGRGDRRLRERDEIADAIGVPVLASVPAGRPGDAAGWVRLLEDYEPAAVQAWGLRKALHHLGVMEARGPGVSVAVVSLSSDRQALALGPQLAAYGASLGIPTVFVLGPQQDENATAMLRTACSGPPEARSWRSGRLRAGVRGRDAKPPEAPLTVVTCVVDAQEPRVADTMRASVTVLAVSAGAATAEQLARVAVSAASDGRQITGILVANPDPADHTTGRLPQPARRGLPSLVSALSEKRW